MILFYVMSSTLFLALLAVPRTRCLAVALLTSFFVWYFWTLGVLVHALK